MLSKLLASQYGRHIRIMIVTSAVIIPAVLWPLTSIVNNDVLGLSLAVNGLVISALWVAFWPAALVFTCTGLHLLFQYLNRR
jgi:Zn-dependent protease with chaperone function